MTLMNLDASKNDKALKKKNLTELKRPNSYPHALVDRLRQDPICLCCWLARGLTGRPCSTSIPNRWEIPL